MNANLNRTLTSSDKPAYDIPTNLLRPMWLRSRESLTQGGLIYDPIAARACQRCKLSPECLSGDVDQKQLLHATLTKLCDQRVSAFLTKYPNGWVVNVGAGLDTRFYRLDNGLCHWLELDVDENLLWREKLFHASERYQLRCGSVNSLEWLESLPVPDSVPVMLVCEQALLHCSERQVAAFIQALGRHFNNASACLVVAGDKTGTTMGKRLGCDAYRHGLSQPELCLTRWLPWLAWVKRYSPLDDECGRWKLWQRLVGRLSSLKMRLTPILLEICW
jgi:O-methyltransferase involved in polyketide biosynthesis